MTQIFTKILALRDYLSGQGQVGLVPTMGALHAGHVSLIDRARRENDCVVVSIFVNPLQFGAGEDFDRYPRMLETDHGICEAAGVDVIFAPTAEEMGIGNEHLTQVIPPMAMMSGLCGRSRIGHFQGVATIVTKLFNIVQPRFAYFGQKDGQQLAIIRRMVQDLQIPVQIVGCETMREASGLALSSRNQYLTETDRQLAAHIYKSLRRSQQQFIHSPQPEPQAITNAAREYLANFPEIDLEYIELVDANTLQPCEQIRWSSELMLAIAVRIKNTRLIDNILLSHTSPNNPNSPHGNVRKPIIAIDGPAGAGKSTVTKQVAQQLGLLFLDTGAMYRSVTLAVLRQGIDWQDQEQVQAIAANSKIQLVANPIANQPMQVFLNDENITAAIRTPEVTAKVSAIAAQPAVREILVKQQQQMGIAGGVVMEGRDIGTHVFPDAEVKIFLTASPQERAKRRQADLIAQGQTPPELHILEQEIIERDRQDSTRQHAPLIQADDATLVNTDGLSIEQVVATIVNLYEAKVQK
ncbi:MAG: bifunctional pantoate--beta-alanine ligase/(d)CMP kinase [Pseudanabaenaceae cyanobacterium bins.39]|nr:bifunctional pantoate--beta-alanine ligase/(d)CMP kinase [Pseudanabaenaceae cyanobacterium bins.39]